METVRLHIVGMSLFMETKILLILETLGNNLAPMKICPGGAWWAPLAPGLNFANCVHRKGVTPYYAMTPNLTYT